MTEPKSKFSSFLDVARGYVLVGTSYAKSTAAAAKNTIKDVVGVVKGEPQDFKTTVIRVDKDGKEIKPAAPTPKEEPAKQQPKAAAPVKTDPTKPTRVKPIYNTTPAPVPAAPATPTPPAFTTGDLCDHPVQQTVAEPKPTQVEIVTKALPIVEAELITEPVEVKRIEKKFDELRAQAAAMDEVMKAMPATILRPRKLF